MWSGIVDKGFTAPAFDAYVSGLTLGVWRPQFVVVHNTSAPTLAQWHGKTPAEQRIKNLESFYRDIQHWHAGPHLFVADDLIWAFTSLREPGVHSPSWNSVSWGVEIVGEYDVEPFTGGIQDNAVAALAALHTKARLDPASMRFHKEDPATTHKDCPGKHIIKADLIARVRDRMNKGAQNASNH